MKAKIIEWGIIITIGFVLATAIRSFLFSTYVVEGRSMQPTLQQGNMLVVNKIGKHFTNYERFDVVVFHANQNEDYIKRVIGLPGEEIYYKDNALYVNGKQVKEPFLNVKNPPKYWKRLTEDFTLDEVTGKTKVPKGYLFVEGDNRLGSFDSRHFGFVPMSKVVGKVGLRYWPVTEINTKF